MNPGSGRTEPGGWRLEHSYAALPAAFHARVQPTPVHEPQLVLFNRALAEDLGLDADLLSRPEAAALFAGNALPPGACPIAQAYAGHQFGHLTRLGDGRALLLGEQITPDGRRFDIQLKGPGQTPFSRRGDGRAALGPMLREYLVSEAMHALRIPTTRSLAVVTTGEPVFRERPLPGAVLTRVAASHVRVGTFALFGALGDVESLQALTRYTLQRHFPDHAGAPNPALALLEQASGRQATLIAHWLRVGFVHGVMNTDNMALSGETIDYGPCAFIDAYDPDAVFSSIDHQGRYAFGNQPGIAGWNLARLAEALLPLLHTDPQEALALARNTLAGFNARFESAWNGLLRGKLGLFTREPGDETLANDFLGLLHQAQADYTHSFRSLDPGTPPANPDFHAWHRRWVERLRRQDATPDAVRRHMHDHNPAVIPRNHVVEAALLAAERDRDLDPFLRLLRDLADPYQAHGKPGALLEPPPAGTPRCTTFCGT